MPGERFWEGGASLSHKVIKSRGPVGSSLPKATQEVVAEHLRAGLSLSETARRVGVSREQVSTVKLALLGVTLRQARDLKARLR